MGKVIHLADVRQDVEHESHFVGLIAEDMEKGNGITEVPNSVFDRVGKLRAKAEENERREALIEG